ncbi:excinuclease ABC subunit UvrA [Wukongibacter baidiensis]|uniref:excinuclease ABC subunit UvrA n=1 Tax=Wukongibacter baidiensis TaxID=1723361 RepID=UPI003D7FEE50
MKSITIEGARIHNLKEIDVSIPKNKLVVVTGVSGSGKSSLAFDIIFEEGRKQYLQSLGVFAGIDDEDKFDNISGIGPTIAVQQNIIRQSNPRSTVGTKTSILKMLAVLYAAEGKISCSTCDSLVGDDMICSKCGNVEEYLPASYFLYNNSNGMCIRCSGKGSYYEMNMQQLIPYENTTLKQIFEIAKPTPGYKKLFNKKFKDYLEMPFLKIPDEVKIEILYGKYTNSNSQNRSYCLQRIFEGRLLKSDDNSGGIYTSSVCSDCGGFRIGEEAQKVFLKGKHIGELGKMTITELHDFLAGLLKQDTLKPLGNNLLKDILHKVNCLSKSRLGHLSLYREMSTLSGGELQRLFLNSHLESKMDSLIYILDEPTSGLHESEKAELLKSIKALKELGNTVIIVEHDKSTIEMADHIIDIGPKAGTQGGQIVYQGDIDGLLKCDLSITGQYLSGKAIMPARKTNQNCEIEKETPKLTIRHAKQNNLKDVTVSLPLGMLVGIAGVSGSGKSSLVSDTLISLLQSHFYNKSEYNETNTQKNEIDDYTLFTTSAKKEVKLEGVEHISGYVEVSQAPIGRNINSNVISYIGIWDRIRKIFAMQPEAIKQNLTAGHFSFNSKGACSECGGSGQEKKWLGDSFFINNICKECHGKRYNDEALSVSYRGKNIVDILEMTVSEAVNFFEDSKRITSTLRVLKQVGMGYIKLGQPTPTLSGGEAQRIKLAKEIGKQRKGNILYVLDEPTVGLSLCDTAKLILLLDELVGNGNSVIVVEHDPEVLSTCDWIIELGPKGGFDGGRIIAEGSPRTLKENPKSKTGRYLNA